MSAVLDTQTAIWYLLGPKKLSPTALHAIRQALSKGHPVHISAISIVEVIYLVERGRLPFDALQKLGGALSDSASGMVVAPVDAAVAETVQKVSRDAVPDMPDRVIAATALHLGLPLVTRDRRIRSAGIKTIW